MRSFRNDYSEGCHPKVLEALIATNLEQTAGYSDDEHCDQARELIRRTMEQAAASAGASPTELTRIQNAQVEFVPGGTMANLLVISAALRPYECVIAAADGHINVHETGAIEATGHKVLTTTDADGMLSVAGIDDVMRQHEYGRNHHMTTPRMLYFSFATEAGLVHTAEQLHELRAYADEHELLIYVDGARLAAGLTSTATDATLADITACADAFTFGGTKNGALFGEAVVILNPTISGNFKAIMKQRGALLAKGRLYGVQFEPLFALTGAEAGVPEAEGDETLYFALGRHANAMAKELTRTLAANGFGEFASPSETNQQFICTDNHTAQKMMDAFECEPFGYPDADHTIVRFVCSWATEPTHIKELDAALKSLSH